MNNVTDFDEDKFFLGTLCKRGHNWNKANQSLRSKTNGDCLKCNRFRSNNGTDIERDTRPKLLVKEMIPQISPELMQLLDISKYFLGSPCKRSHKWNETWYSLRFKCKGGGCVECRKEYQQTEAYKELVEEYRKTDKRKEVQKKYNRSDKGKACQVRYRATGKDRISQKKYHRTEKGKRTSCRIVMRRYARLKQVHCIKRTSEEEAIRYQDFNNQCAYCGATEKLSLDHFLPIAHGGADTISNLVPACMTCNVRKSAQDPKLWYQAQDFYSAKNWKKILKVLGKTDANYLQIPLL